VDWPPKVIACSGRDSGSLWDMQNGSPTNNGGQRNSLSKLAKRESARINNRNPSVVGLTLLSCVLNGVSNPNHLTNSVVSATKILCNIDQCLSNCRIMAVTVSAESFPGLPKYRPRCRHMGSRKAFNLAGNSGPLREMFNIQCFGRLGPWFATGPLGVIRWRPIRRISFRRIVPLKKGPSPSLD
jgi:hypothetical protein